MEEEQVLGEDCILTLHDYQQMHSPRFNQPFYLLLFYTAGAIEVKIEPSMMTIDMRMHTLCSYAMIKT